MGSRGGVNQRPNNIMSRAKPALETGRCSISWSCVPHESGLQLGWTPSYKNSVKPSTPVPQSNRSLDQMRERIRLIHYSLSIEQVYV